MTTPAASPGTDAEQQRLDAAAREWLGMCTWPLTAKDREIIEYLLSKVGG